MVDDCSLNFQIPPALAPRCLLDMAFLLWPSQCALVKPCMLLMLAFYMFYPIHADPRPSLLDLDPVLPQGDLHDFDDVDRRADAASDPWSADGHREVACLMQRSDKLVSGVPKKTKLAKKDGAVAKQPSHLKATSASSATAPVGKASKDSKVLKAKPGKKPSTRSMTLGEIWLVRQQGARICSLVEAAPVTYKPHLHRHLVGDLVQRMRGRLRRRSCSEIC